MEKMQIPRLTDEVWTLPPKISPLSGFQELKTKQLIVSHAVSRANIDINNCQPANSHTH